MSNRTPIETAILRTIAYYDIFDYPLTAAEIWRWLYPKEPFAASSEEVQQSLNEMTARPTLVHQAGHYILPGRAEIIQRRRERKALGQIKWRKAYSAARFLELVPYVKMVAVVNTLAIDNAREESDIDFLIVTSPRHIWIARMMVTGIVAMLGYRRHGTTIKNRICLSFYVTTSAMDFRALQSQSPDHHVLFWTSQAVPIMDDATYQKFVERNAWVTEQLPNSWSWDWRKKLMTPNSGLRSIKRFYEVFFNTSIGQMLEAMARSYQIKRMDKNLHSKSQLGTTEVIVNDDILKFHEDDRRSRYNQAFEARLKSLGVE